MFPSLSSSNVPGSNAFGAAQYSQPPSSGAFGVTERNQFGRGMNEPIISTLRLIPYGPDGPTLYLHGDVLFNYVGPLGKRPANTDVVGISFAWLNSLLDRNWNTDVPGGSKDENNGNQPEVYTKSDLASVYSRLINENFANTKVADKIMKSSAFLTQADLSNYYGMDITSGKSEDEINALDRQLEALKAYYTRVKTGDGWLTSLTPALVGKNFRLLGTVGHGMGTDFDAQKHSSHPMIPTNTNINFGGVCKSINFWGNDLKVGSKLWFCISGYFSSESYDGVESRSPIKIIPWVNPTPHSKSPPPHEICTYETGELQRKIYVPPIFFGTVVGFDVGENRVVRDDQLHRAWGINGESWDVIKTNQALLGKVKVKRGERLFGY